MAQIKTPKIEAVVRETMETGLRFYIEEKEGQKNEQGFVNYDVLFVNSLGKSLRKFVDLFFENYDEVCREMKNTNIFYD